jgi:class 3 adenylate cyclase
MAGSAPVSVLFTDLAGSTEILSRLGDDAADVLRRRHFSILREAISAHGGEEVKSLGDGLMVVFDEPSAGAACAVAMQEGIAMHNDAARSATRARTTSAPPSWWPAVSATEPSLRRS